MFSQALWNGKVKMRLEIRKKGTAMRIGAEERKKAGNKGQRGTVSGQSNGCRRERERSEVRGSL